MTAKDQRRAERLPRVRRGDPITARLFNRLSVGINTALGLNPPRSLKVRSTDEQVNELMQPENTGVMLICYEEQSRVSSTVRVYQDGDPSSDNWVDVERIDQITFIRTNGDTLVLVFDND